MILSSIYLFKMKIIIVLIQFLTVVSTASPWNIKEKESPQPLTPKARQSEQIRKFLYLKQLLELNCLKSVYNKMHFESRRPFGIVKPLHSARFRNDRSNQRYQNTYKFNKLRPFQIKNHPLNQRRYFGDSKIIYVPSSVQLKENIENTLPIMKKPKDSINRQTSSLKTTTGPLTVEVENKTHEVNIINIEMGENPGREQESREQVLNEKDQKPEENSETISVSGSKKLSNFLLTPTWIKSTTYPYSSLTSFWNEQQPISARPYEVHEIIEENLSFDVEDNGNIRDYKNFKLDEEKVFVGTMKEKNPLHNRDSKKSSKMIGDSINTVIKNLMAPVTIKPLLTDLSKRVSSREKFLNRTTVNSQASFSPTQIFSQRSPNFSKNINDDKLLLNLPKEMISTPSTPISTLYSLRQNTGTTTRSFEKVTTETENNNENHQRYDFAPVRTVEYKKNVRPIDTTKQTSEISYTSSGVFKSGKNIHLSDFVRDSQEVTTDSTDDFDGLGFPSIIKYLFEDQQSTSVGLYASPATETTHEYPTKQTSKSEKPNSFYTISEIPIIQIDFTNSGNEIQSTSTDSAEELTENPTEETKATSTTENNIKANDYFSEASINNENLNTPDFQEFTDYPTSFDLLTTFESELKKEQETVWKNSRKMHFEQEAQKTTAAQTAELENTEQRRSDILITENVDDYDDVDNNLPIQNYLEKLRGSNSTSQDQSGNSTINSIIHLIPFIINDLREGKIPPEDIKFLSKTFDKHWTDVLSLVNRTNIDLLPLIKMKNEEDLKNVLGSFSSDTLEPTTTQTTQTNNDNYNKDEYLSYDYLQEYKDLYEEVLQQELEEEEGSQKKLRSKRDEQKNFKKTEVVPEYFESLQEKDKQNSYFYEDVTDNEEQDEEIRDKTAGL